MSAKPKVVEENIPLGAHTKYDTALSTVVRYINKARQIATAGPGLAHFECPLIPNLTKGEIDRFVGEIHKLMPSQPINVLHAGTAGTGIYATMLDPSYKPPVADKVDPATIKGDPQHKRLWQVCRDQAAYVSGKDTDNHEKPDCSSGCRYFHPLEGKHGMDWGVCTEPRSSRAGLLTFEHMGCQYFEQAPDEIEPPPPPKKPKTKPADKKPEGSGVV
jgi:hypothetical protein